MRRYSLRQVPIKERFPFISIDRGQIDVADGAVVLTQNNDCVPLPVATVCCLILEPGTRISHSAIKIAAQAGCLILWAGEGGVRLYASGNVTGMRSDRLVRQAQLSLHARSRLMVARKMYSMRFKEEAPTFRSIEQLRGIEGGKVKQKYEQLASLYSVPWPGRVPRGENLDIVNACLTTANSCLYGVCEAAILAAGYSPAFGFMHSGCMQSFVYDIADLFKFETTAPVAFEIASRNHPHALREVRRKCRDIFRETRLMGKLIPAIHNLLCTEGDCACS